ncbi:MAG: hypothetical protein JO186_04760 [Actinobacteria bacterium]|nr:hypothetical protein [Actinomycetota bacterium]MBV8396252.1 hypothetical protein [Actinomycetota bacterium]MBV8598137.1 hypothetical protein [Actinomycetota bacterium]
MAQPANQPRFRADELPSLDPAAIEVAYLRERARRRVRHERRTAAQSSNARFWVVIAVLLFLTVLFSLSAWHEVQTTFGL